MRQNGDIFAGDYLRQGSPTNTTRQESVPRGHATANIAIAATGVVPTAAIPLQAGDLVGAITFVTGTTAAGTPTAGYLALRSPAGVVLAQSADPGRPAGAARTPSSLASSSPGCRSWRRHTVRPSGPPRRPPSRHRPPSRPFPTT